MPAPDASPPFVGLGVPGVDGRMEVDTDEKEPLVMKSVILATAILGIAGAVAWGAPSPEINAEAGALLEPVKSADAATREAGVRELVGLRQAVQRELIAMVNDANAGRATAAAKGSALYVMGEMQLVGCADILRAEGGWIYDNTLPSGVRDGRVDRRWAIRGLRAIRAAVE